MATTPDSQNLALSVTNLGPIAKAKIDLRPLTVFVGPSNTGKSYMAVLIYALHQFFSAYSGRKDFRPFSRVKQRQNLDLSEHDISNLYAWAKETLPDLETNEHEESCLIELPESIAVLIHTSLNNVAHLSEDLENEIARCFGVGTTKNLVRHSSSGRTGFSLQGNTSKETSHNNHFGYKIIVTEQGIKIDASIPRTIPLRIGRDSISNTFLPIRLSGGELQRVGAEQKEIATAWLGFLAGDIISHTIGPFSHPAYYLPADRAGVMHGHQVVVRALIASASRVALRRDSPMPVLSGVLGDFLEQLVALASSTLTRRESEEVNDLANGLERTLLRGTVRVERSQIDYPSFVYRPDGWEKDLPLMNASSMVSELAPVVLYLRHVVRPGDLLIIEEPESHLHPAMQVEFVRQLAVAVKSGIRILITTHSEWVLEELANLVRLSELPQEQRKGIDDPDVALRQDEVGAWFFEPNLDQSGSVVREMPLDVESGTFSSGFGLITEGLYNRWADISNRIEEE